MKVLLRVLDWLFGPVTQPRPRRPRPEGWDLIDAIIRTSLAREHPLGLRYVDAKGVITERMVIPQEWEGWMLRAYCHLRQAPRHFRVDRILQLVELEPIEEGAEDAD